MVGFLLVYENRSEESCKCPISLSSRVNLYNWIHFLCSLLEKNPILQAGNMIWEPIIHVSKQRKVRRLFMVDFCNADS